MTTAVEQELSKNLFYKEGSSDKVYQLQLKKEKSGYVVNFQYGRRGNTLQAGTKTDKPVSYDKALPLFEKLLKEKSQKGYTEDSTGTPYVLSDKEDRITGVYPQLLNPMEEEDVDNFIKDDQYWMQEKKDGKRILLRKSGSEVEGINRKGLIVGLPEHVVKHADLYKGSWLIDGECVGDTFWAFDLLELRGKDFRKLPYSIRYDILKDLFGESPSPHVTYVIAAKHKIDKLGLFRKLKDENAEGVVFKDKDSVYTPGRPNSGGPQQKFKFLATASVIVAGEHVVRGKRSVPMEIIEKGKRVSVGKVTIPPNKDIPKEGTVIEVQYLYAYPGGSLFQPVYLGERDDIEPEECLVSQFKFKAGTEEEDN